MTHAQADARIRELLADMDQACRRMEATEASQQETLLMLAELVGRANAVRKMEATR